MLNFVGTRTVVTVELYVYNLTGIEHVLGETHLTTCLRAAEKHEPSHLAEDLKPVVLGLNLQRRLVDIEFATPTER